MMFATKRSLADACTSVARQLENVYSSIAVISSECTIYHEQHLVIHFWDCKSFLKAHLKHRILDHNLLEAF